VGYNSVADNTNEGI